MAIFQPLFLGNIGQENVFHDIVERKIAFLGYKNIKFKQSKNWDFSKGANPWFWSKNGHFSNFFFLGNIRQENVFFDILQRKNAFLAYKNKKFKKSKNRHFSKGVNPWFLSKNGHFSTFFFGNIVQENVLYDILQRKIDFLGYKSIKFNKSKLDVFPKRLTHVLFREMAIFPTFFFRQYRPGKCLLWYSTTKKRLSRL